MAAQHHKQNDAANRAQPAITEFRMTPDRPRVGDDIVIHFTAHNATSVTFMDHLGGYYTFSQPLVSGARQSIKLKAKQAGRFLLEAEAAGAESNTTARITGWIRRPIPLIEISMPPAIVLNAPVVIEWNTVGLDRLFVEHSIEWLDSFHPSLPLPLSGGVRFDAKVPGFHEMRFRGHTASGWVIRKSANLRVRSSDGFFENGEAQ